MKVICACGHQIDSFHSDQYNVDAQRRWYHLNADSTQPAPVYFTGTSFPCSFNIPLPSSYIFTHEYNIMSKHCYTFECISLYTNCTFLISSEPHKYIFYIQVNFSTLFFMTLLHLLTIIEVVMYRVSRVLDRQRLNG